MLAQAEYFKLNSLLCSVGLTLKTCLASFAKLIEVPWCQQSWFLKQVRIPRCYMCFAAFFLHKVSKKTETSHIVFSKKTTMRFLTLVQNQLYWSVNITRFEQFFRDQAVVAAVTKKHGVVCGEWRCVW